MSLSAVCLSACTAGVADYSPGILLDGSVEDTSPTGLSDVAIARDTGDANRAAETALVEDTDSSETVPRDTRSDPTPDTASPDTTLVDTGAADTATEPPKPTAKERVLAFLAKTDGKTLTGIHNRHNATPGQYTGQMFDVTGKYPALWGGDFLFEPDDIAHRSTMIAQAKTEWSHGAIVSLLYHACPPDVGEPCGWDPGLMHHPLNDTQWNDLITEGGVLNKAWKARLDIIAPFLQELKVAGVAPLFRPLHEMNQGAFWWGGRTGPKGTARLYQITHDYLVKVKGLDNIIWVWDVQDLSWDFDRYDPGEAYYDVAALDIYDGSGYTTAKYEAMKKASPHRPIAIGECQKLPTEAELRAQPQWAFFMGWSELVRENNTDSSIKSLFGASNVLTLDKMPGWTRP